jgi:hypothetical protein
VSRIAYRARGQRNLCPADALLNLPVEKHSHGLRRHAAIESSRGSFDDAVAAIERVTGQQLGKRQVEALAQCAAADFHGFYEDRKRATEAGDALVISCDGKGVVMRHDALRAATRRQAQSTKSKLKTRLSKGGEAQPQTDGRGRRDLRHHAHVAQGGRHPARRRRAARRRQGCAARQEQVADRQRRR